MTRGRVVVLMLTILLPVAAYGQDVNEEFLAAARKGDAEAVKAFLAKGVDVNTKTRYGATALAYAADKGHVAVVKVLIEHGADVNVKDTFYGATPIIWAGQKGHAEIVKALLDKGATASKDQLLMMGVSGGHVELVKLMLERGGLLPETLTLALTRATKDNRAEIIELLQRAGAKPAPKADFKVDVETLKTYTGVYKNDRLGELTITLKDGKLTGQLVGQGPFTTAAIDKTTFTVVEVDGITIKFNLEGDRVIGFTLKQSGATLEFKRVEQK